MSSVKRGDATPYELDLHTDLSEYESATVILLRVGTTDPVEITGTIDGQTVMCDLTAEHTAEVCDYQVEVEMLPGPHTYPSFGFLTLSVVSDLNP